MKKCSDMLVGLSTAWSVVFVEAIFASSPCFSLYRLTGFALNPVNKVFRVADNVVSNKSSFADEKKYVRSKASLICRCT